MSAHDVTIRDASTDVLADTERALVGKMTGIVVELLHSLAAEQRALSQWAPLTDPDVEAERVRWFYTPTDHGGLALRDLLPQQQSLVMQLVSTALTRSAYVTLCTVLGLENVLDELEGWHTDWGRERGRDPGLYWLRVFGDPGESTWGWRFGGHHVSVNLLVREGRIAAVTPCFLGADPASSPLLGDTLRPLGGTEDAARTLMESLTPAERKLALLHPRAISDIVSGNRARVQPGDQMMHMQQLFRSLPTPRLAALVDRIDEVAEGGSEYTGADHERMALGTAPAGLAASELDLDQRELLRSLLATYTDRSPEPIAEAHRRLYLADDVLDGVVFGWAGDIAPGAPHYYRLCSPRLLVEYDNTQRDANHAHSVWRDPMGDFGLDPLGSHQATSQHG
ncbi:DUF3500 domain-containing protein [Nocardioides sp.]|uniref:DUF3500 domain-containing protein n=1 Tax=Nocardioides sp. TaxID=35761 RepID=UPI0031FE611C|nr:uncharacterized protein [Nocardioides sp.]